MHIVGLSSAHVSHFNTGNLNHNSVTKTASASLEMTGMKISQNSLNGCMAERVWTKHVLQGELFVFFLLSFFRNLLFASKNPPWWEQRKKSHCSEVTVLCFIAVWQSCAWGFLHEYRFPIFHSLISLKSLFRNSYCRLRWRGDLVQGRLGDPPLGRSGHQHADTNVVDGKWRLLINNTALYSLGLQHHFRLLTSQVKCYWLLGEGGGDYLSVQRDIFRPPSLNYPHWGEEKQQWWHRGAARVAESQEPSAPPLHTLAWSWEMRLLRRVLLPWGSAKAAAACDLTSVWTYMWWKSWCLQRTTPLHWSSMVLVSM